MHTTINLLDAASDSQPCGVLRTYVCAGRAPGRGDRADARKFKRLPGRRAAGPLSADGGLPGESGHQKSL